MGDSGDVSEVIDYLIRASNTASSSDRTRLHVPGGNPPSPRVQPKQKAPKPEWYRRPMEPRTTLAFILLAIILASAFIIAWFTRPMPPEPLLIRSTSPETQFYRYAAVSADSSLCSKMATQTLARGGSAVDAAITALVCGGAVHPQSAGVGGGFHAIIWDAPSQTAYTLDARETVPAGFSDELMAEMGGSLSRGPFSIGVPGEVAGMWAAHQRFGRLSWYSLFKPTIDLCRRGFPMSEAMAETIEAANFFMSKFSETFYEKLKKWFRNPKTSALYQTGDIYYCHELANVLERIAVNGSDEFYNGTLSDDIISDLKDIGAPLTKDDLSSYRPVWRKPLLFDLNNGLRMISMRPPGSGALLAYILNILQAFDFTPADIEQPLTYHRILEATKFAQAKRIFLGDEDFVTDRAEFDRMIAEMLSPNVAHKTRLWINDTNTHPASFYDPVMFDQSKDYGTSHLSVLAADGSAVSLTSTINLIFGSGYIGKRSGIIFNNELDDFYSSSRTSSWGMPPPNSPNFVQPGKRPMSSMCPAIFVVNNSLSVSSDRSVRLVIGATGGSRITSATAGVAARVLFFKENVKQAIEAPRFHHQRASNTVLYETRAPQGLLKYMRDVGHTKLEVSTLRYRTVVNAVQEFENGTIIAFSDDRKSGLLADGF